LGLLISSFSYTSKCKTITFHWFTFFVSDFINGFRKLAFKEKNQFSICKRLRFLYLFLYLKRLFISKPEHIWDSYVNTKRSFFIKS